jgi:hypothetical protein
VISRWFAIPVAFVLIAASGIASGVWDNRWFVSNELTTVSRRLNELPLDFGNWKGEEVDQDPDTTARLIRQGTFHAIKTRVYHNIVTNESVNVLVATGRPGPISTHNPMTCVVNKGAMVQSSDPTDATTNVPVFGPVGYTQCNIRNTAAAGRMEEWTIFWTWHSAKGWIATNNPRLTFASYRALTKLYVIRSNRDIALGLKSYDPTKGDDPAVQFLKDCVPLIDQALYGPGPGDPAPKA